MLSEQTKAKIIILDIQDLPTDLKSSKPLLTSFQHLSTNTHPVRRVFYYKGDLSSPKSIHETIAQILDENAVPTVLINNAGMLQAHSILNTTDEWLEKIFRVNLLSHFTLIRLLLPKMMAQQKGHIVSIASVASFTGCASLADYCATKSGVLGLHETLIAELGNRYKDQGGHAIQASIVHPL